MTMLRRFLTWLMLPLLLAACSPAPGPAELERDVSERLVSAFDGDVLELASLRRLGSAPASAGADGAARRIVYYNATLKLERDYAFNDWDALNPKALAAMLGATTRGIQGIAMQGNRAGDELRVHGSIMYRAGDEGWRQVAFVQPPPARAPELDNTGPPAQARRTIERIRTLFDHPPAEESRARAIITEELDAAYHQIALRLERLERAFLIAGGPLGGEYHGVAQAIAGFATGRGIRSAHLETHGSLENLNLLAANRADVAIVQNDVAARFVAEHGEAGPGALRALGSLFPEPLHIVVRADSDIRGLEDLRGRRVDLGLPDSGTRRTAQTVLQAHGMAPDALQDSALGGVAAAGALRRGEIDAFAAVIHAPARFIQELAADTDIRLLPVGPPPEGGDPGLVPVVLPPGTYPGHGEAVSTLAVAALLVARADLEDKEALLLVDAVYRHLDFSALGSGAGAQISARTARVGISIPLHDAVLREAQALPEPAARP